MGDRVAVMKAGILQEVGDPQYLYDNPANIFVAGFIGSPPMNLAVGKIVRPDDNGPGRPPRLGHHRPAPGGRPAASRPGRLRVPRRRRGDPQRGHGGRPAGPRRPADTRLKATVSMVEALGAQIVVHFEVDAPKVVTADTKLLEKDAHTDEAPSTRRSTGPSSWPPSPPLRVRIGDQIEVVVDTERMHFFDPETGNAIRD